MKVIYNKIIPFKGYKAITIWPFIFARKKLSEIDINHEKIHLAQQLELLIIPFYIIYFIEWIFKRYRNISFEKEAYANQEDMNYLEWRRKSYAMWRK